MRRLFATAILALALPAYAQAADPAAERGAGDPPGFNELDANRDGVLAADELARNPTLAARARELDADGDGRVTRMEYLRAMAKQDLNTLRQRAAEIIRPDDKPSSGASR